MIASFYDLPTPLDSSSSQDFDARLLSNVTYVAKQKEGCYVGCYVAKLRTGCR